MKRISELFDDFWRVEDIENELYVEECFGELDQEEEKRILNNAMKRINVSNDHIEKRRRRIGGKKLVFTVLAATMLFAFTVSAKEENIEKIRHVIEKIIIKNPLAEKFGIKPEQDPEEVPIENIVEGDNTQAECGGVKVAVEQMMSDGDDIYVYASVTIPEELIPEDEVGNLLYFSNCKIQLGNREPQDTCFIIKKDDRNQRYGIIHISVEELEKKSYEANLTLGNLKYEVWNGNKKQSEKQLVEGQWTLQWTVRYEETAKRMKFEETIETYDGTIETEEVIISPFSVKIVGRTELTDLNSSSYKGSISKVILKNGIVRGLGSRMTGVGEGTYVMQSYFDQMIPIEDIAGVVIGEQYFYFE